MSRAFYSHEIDDPDLDWLITTFLSERPNYMPVDSASLPIVLIPVMDEFEEALEPPKVEARSKASYR